MVKKCVIVSAAAVIFAMSASAQHGQTGAELAPLHPVNTYSIVCYDSVTGEFGAAVQSHWFKVADVIWAEPGELERSHYKGQVFEKSYEEK